jgi:CheY-like chemotaxis protein
MLAALGAQPPDIVISDYRLAKGLTGYEAIPVLRARFGAALPAIIISGDTDPVLLRRMNDRGIVVLHKPLDIEELQTYLEDLTYPASASGSG